MQACVPEFTLCYFNIEDSWRACQNGSKFWHAFCTIR